MVFARDATAFNTRYGFNPDFGDLTLSLANGGDVLKLRDSGAALIDSVAWEGKSSWNLHAIDNESIKRAAFPISADSWLSNQTPRSGESGTDTRTREFFASGFGIDNYAASIAKKMEKEL